MNALYRAMETVAAVGTVKKLNNLFGQVFYEVQQKGILSRNPAEWTNVPQKDAHDGEGDDSSAQAMDRDQADRFLTAAHALADAQGDDLHSMPERCWSALWHVLMVGPPG